MTYIGSVDDVGDMPLNFLNELRRHGNIKGYPDVVGYQKKRFYEEIEYNDIHHQEFKISRFQRG